MEVTLQLVADRSKAYKGTNGRRFITVHETANRNRGADAQAHANLQSRGNVRSASWHESIDDTEVIQSFPHTVQCWHAGDGKGDGNLNSIALEICVNEDGNFAQAVANAAARVSQLMAMYDIPLSRVVQHNRWSGKNCPTFLRSGSQSITWSQFIAMVDGGTPPVITPTPNPTPTPTPGKDPVMAKLPKLDWTSTKTQFDPNDERVQALLKVQDCYAGELDGRRGPISRAGLKKFQETYNCGDGKGGADMKIGDKTWESLLLGTKWPRS